MTRLQHGQFFGAQEITRAAGGFSLSVRSADPERVVERHTHEDAHFILLLDGHYLSTARGAGHLHAEPALIYNPPGTTHRDTFPERCGRFLAVSLSREVFAEAAELPRTAEAAVRIWEPSSLAVAQQLDQALAHEAPALALEALGLELVGAFVNGDRGDRRPPRWLELARELLRARALDDGLGMTEVARIAGVHPVHLARSFRRFFGCSPADYVRHCRAERAAILLRATPRPLADIAFDCGFVDQSHFTRSFARAFGTSPGAYRRRYRSRA